MTATEHRHSPRLTRRRAFTLVEVMISVALVLILIIGINQAFKMVTDTVGMGQTMGAITRDNRAIQPVLYGDLRASVTQNPPAFIIAASRVSAFRNRTDELSDLDYAAAPSEANIRTIDLDNDNTEGGTTVGEVISPATYNFRSHRTDRLAFFARDQYRRQTGNDGQYTSPLTGGEAYIWYGHLRLLNNADATVDTNYQFPGAGTFATNPYNFHAANFALGRMVMMLRANESTTAGTSVITDNSTGTPIPQEHIRRVASVAGRLSPLTHASPATDGAYPVQASRYDLAATTISEYYEDVRVVSGQPHTIPPVATAEDYWYQRLLYSLPYGSPPANSPPFPQERDYRFAANRFFARPLDAQKAARVAPILASGCTQFIVEFAGDYVTQTQAPGTATDGDITGINPDGVLDFLVDTGAPGSFERRTRWYGMPRDTSGNVTTNANGAVIGGPDGKIIVGTSTEPGNDVLPVRDIRGRLGAIPPTHSIFERNHENDLKTEGGTLPAPATEDYLAPATGMDADARYTCVWGPDCNPSVDPLPQMLRITIVLDEPAGRLADGLTYEYVIDLP